MKESSRYLFIMLGFLGSGKSYVSRWLVPKVGGIYIRVDDLRLEMFGEDRPELYRPENKALVNNAAQYFLKQSLATASVVFDANNNAARLRKDEIMVAADQGAQAIVVYIQTPLDVAKQRTIDREHAEGHKLFAPNLVEDMAKRLEPPTPDELVITIDGLADTKEQQRQFDEQFARIRGERLQ